MGWRKYGWLLQLKIPPILVTEKLAPLHLHAARVQTLLWKAGPGTVLPGHTNGQMPLVPNSDWQFPLTRSGWFYGQHMSSTYSLSTHPIICNNMNNATCKTSWAIRDIQRVAKASSFYSQHPSLKIKSKALHVIFGCACLIQIPHQTVKGHSMKTLFHLRHHHLTYQGQI